ncbi:hypothetical protein EQW76_00880 [Rhizobium sp. rho-13.1]|uniref:hypothetical protein n=1 Tax=Rhizobium sp. rho-13.1 TaxID=2506431 RepID=UPI00115CEC3F|nr:hypothetical protein [Rhizobium sp. rho-13.1]TQX91321.1 hypothetical protein EQW76_00880 [Rhizobium sp. rho-13.1]
MRFLIAVVAVVTVTSGAGAQQVMDGSDGAVAPSDISVLLDKLISQTGDPYAAQLIKLHHSPADPANLCGFVNLKNASGGYTGFQPFMIYGGNLVLQSADQCQ